MSFHEDDLFYPWYFLGEFRSNIINMITDPIIMNKEKKELIRLSEDLLSCDISVYEMIYINIGSAENNCSSMVRQLPPFIEISGNRTLIILIDKFEFIPNIIKSKNFLRISYNTYTNGIIDIRIYNTFFPTWLNSEKQSFQNIIKQNIIEKQNTSKDREFVCEFYNNLKKFIQRSVGNIYIVSTATFLTNESTENSGNINFELFPELLQLIGLEKLIILVWPYNSIYYYSWGTMKRINYTEPVNINEQNLINTNVILGNYYRLKTRLE